MGVGAIAIVRMSGDEALSIASRLFHGKLEDRKLNLGQFVFEDLKEQCLAVYFKAPRSFTGEDMVEFQVHGGVIVARKVLEALLESGARLAENGEFSKRAFLNGKLSLSSAEGMIDVINASSEAELKAGYNLMSGELSKFAKDSQTTLTDMLAELEVALDYPEHDDEAMAIESARKKLEDMIARTETLLATVGTGKLIKSGVSVAIVGKPNVGKSSLLNALLGEDRAIVTSVEGTTRDTISETISYSGYNINFVDTAGVRESDDEVEKIGIERSKKAIESADVVLLLIDSSRELDERDQELIKLTEGKRRILVLNKCDLKSKVEIDGIKVSAKRGEGVEELKKKILDSVDLKVDTSGLVITNMRHEEALKEALNALKEADSAAESESADIVAFLVKRAWTAFGKITGETENEAIIDKIFSKFCLGK